MATQTATGTTSPPRPKKRRSLGDRLKMATKASLDTAEQRAAQQTLEAMDKAKDAVVNVTQNVTPDSKSHMVTNEVKPDTTSHHVTPKVTSDEESHIVTQKVTPDTESHAVTGPVIADTTSHHVTPSVTSDGASHITTQEVTSDTNRHQMPHPVTSDTKSHILTQKVTPLIDTTKSATDAVIPTTYGSAAPAPDAQRHHVTQEVTSDKESHTQITGNGGDTSSDGVTQKGTSDTKSHHVTLNVTPDVESHTMANQGTRRRSHTLECSTVRSPQIRSAVQTRLYDYLYESGAHIDMVFTSVGTIAKVLDVTRRSILRIFSQWEEAEIMERAANYRGTGIRLLKLPHQLGLVTATPYSVAMAHTEPQTLAGREDEEMSVLGITGTTIREEFPHLHKAGFGLHQLQQVEQRLRDANLPTDMVRDSLGFAEYELANDLMRDGKGTAVASPSDWLFKCLCKSGCYRRPKGYIDPLEAAREQLEAQLAARRKRMADIERLREEQAALEQNEIIEERLQAIMQDPNSDEYQKYAASIPDFIRARGAASSMFQRSLRIAIKNELFPE